MNPEALESAYKLFVDTGYNGTSDDFSSLINSNQEALNASFNQFVETGYNGSEEDFKNLVGVNKVENTTKVKEPEAAPIKEKIISEVETFDWKPSLSAEEYEALPLMNKERANWEKFKEIELNKQKEEVVKSDVTADTDAFSSLEDIPKYEGLTQSTSLAPDKDGLYSVFIKDGTTTISTPSFPGEPSFTSGDKTIDKRKANKEDMEVLLPVMDALQKEAFKNLPDYGFGNENALGSDTYTISTEQHAIIKDRIYDKFVEKSGIPIDKGSFDFLYNETIVDNKDQVERDYKSNRIRPESTEVSSEFKKMFVLEADKGKSEVELTSDSLKAKQFEITKELNNINNVLIPQAINRTVDKDESSTKRNHQLDDLNKRKIELENNYKDLDKAIEQNATSIKVIGGWMPGDPLSFQGKPRTYKEINEELNSKFFNMQGRSEESTKKLNKVSQNVENTAGVRAQNLINENLALSQREAVEQLFNDELLYLQQFEADGRNSFVNLKFTPEQLSGGNPMGAKVLRALDANGLKKNIDDSGNINISLYDLRAAGIDSRNFEGYFDELGNLISSKDLTAVKMYNEEVDEVTVAARTFRNLAINNVDVGAIEKPDGFVNLLQTGAVATLETLGMDKGEAEEFLTGTTEGTARTQIDNLDRAIKTANNTPEIQASMGGKIELTENQKENISTSMTEEVTSGIGGFVPDLMILGATGGVMNAMGYAKLISKMSPMARFITGAAVEEAKMQTILGMKPGGGATFYTLGAATSGIGFKKKFKWLDPLFQKVIKAGPIGAISAEGAGVAELAYESFMGDKNFKDEFDEMYKDFSTVSRRAIVNSMVFGLTGFTHVKRSDFMTTQRKYEVVSELKNEVNNLMGQKLDFVDGPSSELKLDKDGVVIPDALKPKKQFKDLSPKDQKKFAEYTQRIQTLNQQIQAETMYHKLDPNSKNFEQDFDKMITEPMNRAMKALVPNFEGVKVKFGRRSDTKTPMFKKNFDSAENTAQYNPKTKEMFFDLDAYTAGKPPHEFTHVALNAYLEANPGMKLNFTKNLGKVFEGFDFGEFEGTELAKRIKERYNIDLRTWKGKNLAAEEYLAFMGEFLADPKVYYTNPDLASTFMNEVRLEVKDFLVEAGLKTPNVKTAKDVVQLLGRIGSETRMGGRFEVKMQTLAKLDEIDVIGAELVKANREAEAKKLASKDLTKEVEGVEKEKVETMVNKVANRAFTKFYKGIPVNVREKAGLDRKTYLESAKTELQEIAREFDPNKKDKDGNPIAFDRFMANRGMQRMNSLATRLGVESAEKPTSKRLGQERAEGEKEFDIKSEDATPEDALIASEESSSTGRKGITVSKKLGSKADKVVAEIKRKIPVEKELQEKFLEDKTYKSLKDLAAKETQEMFGIKPKPGNLTKSDVKNAQIFINNNPDLFYGLLPKQHTTKRVNVGTSKEPKYVTRPDKATGVQKVLLEAFYNKGTRKDNLTPWTKKPARDIKTSEFLKLFGITERGNPNLYVKNSNVSSRIKALVEQTGRIITNQTVREVLPEARLVGEGRSKTMASKNLVVKEIKRIGLKDYSLEKLEKDLKLIASNKGTKRPKEVEDFLIDYKRREMLEASQETPTFKSESKLFKGTKFKNQDVTFEDIFNSETGKGVWGQTRRNGKKIYEEYDLPRIEEQIEQAIRFAEVFPKAFLKGENLMQTFFMGTRSTAKQVRTLLDGNSKTPKYVKGTVDPKTGIGVEIGTVASLKNQRARLEKALGSGKTSKFFKGLIADYKPEGVQKGTLKKAMEKASTDAERIEILQKAINKGDNKIKSDLYYAIESAKQEWLYSSKDKNEFIQRARFIYQGASSNTNLILGSSRQFVPIEAVYFKPGEKFSFEKLKLEHLKSSLKQSMDAARAVVEGRFIEQGRDIMSDYKGIISEKKYLDIIDKIGGTTNTSGLSRMTADLNNLKNYRTVESGFKETLYDKIIKETAKEINEKSFELENSFIADQVARYIAEPTPSNEIILKSKIKNKANLRKLKFQNKSVVEEASMASKDLSQSEMLNELNKRDKAFRLANERSKTIKKARVFDFDDTVARTNSKVFAERDGKRKVLTAEEFATKGKELVDAGWVMDFTDFNRVVEGKKGPLFELMKKMKEAAGDRDMFILTARAPESAPAIKEFLDAMGINIPLENITGLGNSTGRAKADWLVDKASEGYNDFYFADDAPQNVKAVRDALEVLDVKSKTQQAYASKDLSKDFNNLIEESTGIGAEKIFSDVKAQVRGAKAKRQRFFIPPSAEDMLGLVYTTLGKGKKGEAHLKFYQENLFDPYTRAMENLSTDRVNLMADFKALKKELDVPKDLAKKTESGFTNEQAVRVHLWNKMGEKIPGLSKTDLKELNDIVEGNPKLEAFADQIISITKGDGYSMPKENWAVGTITTDLIDILNTKKRGKYLETWKQNKDLIYSKDNLNKLEAAYGPKYRAAVENSLRRMESGSNRLGGGNQLSNKVLDYINNSTGAIMFFNTRSAVLQTISAANFINWGFNNPFRAGKAFANQPQYWKDFTELINSDYLKDRRNGLKLNINESEIANAAKTSGNKAKAGLNYILEKGYAPTKFADSFAIASGGATFYRNRINDLIKNEGKTEAEAKEIAMKEFRQVSEMSQQSSDPSKISQQQSSDLGRVVLQFANTPMQYARIQKRAVQDIVNGRGDLKTNISKIAYYGFLQNMLFNALQQGVFALGFGDDEIDAKEEKKLVNAANGMLDSSLRGLGMAGVTVQVLKNLGINIYDRSKRDRPEYGDSYKKLLDFSPAIKSKLGKFQSAAYPFDSKKRRAEVFEKGFSLDNPAYESMAKVVTGTTNLPLDRLYSKVNNLSAAMDQETETWQSVAMVLGWPEWQIKGKQNYVESPEVKKKKSLEDKFL